MFRKKRLIASTTLWLFIAFGLMPVAVMAEWVPRPDAMHWHGLMDRDQRAGVVRVLYKTMPALEQSKLTNAAVSVYVAELHPDGRIENRTIQSGQRHFSSLLLQRGGDGILAVVTPAHGDASATVEHLSAIDGKLLSSFESTDLLKAGTGLQMAPTDDGNFFYVMRSAQSARGNQPNTLTWKKISLTGEILAMGEWSKPHAISGPTGTFPARGGGLGLVMGVRLTSDSHVLETDVEAVQPFEIGGRQIEARVFAETRLLATDATAAVQWLSPAIERELIWGGDMGVPQTLPPDEMIAQSNQQMALMARVRLKNGGDRRIMSTSNSNFADVQRTPNGYGMLVDVAADKNLDPPLRGLWFIEIGNDGSLLREQRIEPAAEQLDAKFDRFKPTEDGGLLVAGTRRQGKFSLHLTALGSDGEIEWTSKLSMNNAKIDGIGGTEAKPWVYGESYNESESKNQMWAELVDPSMMNAVDGQPAAVQASQARPQPAKTTSTAPAFKMPEPAEGCTCSCEEFATIQEITDKMKSASQAEVMSMVSDPAYQQMMQCMGGCAMQYAQCR